MSNIFSQFAEDWAYPGRNFAGLFGKRHLTVDPSALGPFLLRLRLLSRGFTPSRGKLPTSTLGLLKLDYTNRCHGIGRPV